MYSNCEDKEGNRFYTNSWIHIKLREDGDTTAGEYFNHDDVADNVTLNIPLSTRRPIILQQVDGIAHCLNEFCLVCGFNSDVFFSR